MRDERVGFIPPPCGEGGLKRQLQVAWGRRKRPVIPTPPVRCADTLPIKGREG
jgi:hypothetical protein